MRVVILFVFASSFFGCSLSPIQRQTTAINVIADITAAASVEVGDHAAAERAASCPSGEEVCLIPLRQRWAPADAVIDGLHDALDLWRARLALDVAGHRDPGSDVRLAIEGVRLIYENGITTLPPFGITLPVWPQEAVDAIVLLMTGGQ